MSRYWRDIRFRKSRPTAENALAWIWGVGICLAVALYITGPEMFLSSVAGFFDGVSLWFQSVAPGLGSQAFEVIRAFTVALMIMFFALCAVADIRKIRARKRAMFIYALVFLLLVGPGSGDPIHPERWVEAFAVIALGSGYMTLKLKR